MYCICICSCICICIVMASSPSLSMTRSFVYPTNRAKDACSVHFRCCLFIPSAKDEWIRYPVPLLHPSPVNPYIFPCKNGRVLAKRSRKSRKLLLAFDSPCIGSEICLSLLRTITRQARARTLSHVSEKRQTPLARLRYLRIQPTPSESSAYFTGHDMHTTYSMLRNIHPDPTHDSSTGSQPLKVLTLGIRPRRIELG